VQQKGETLCSYIQRWSIIKNSTEDVSEERVIDAFSSGLRRSDLVEEIGRTRPRTVSELMEVTDSLIEKMHTTTKGDVQQKSTEQAGRGEGIATKITTQGEIR
jgi:hypothetical protein